MNSKKKKIQKLIESNTVSTKQVFAGFTNDQNKIVDEEIKYYDMLLEIRRVRAKLNLSQQELADKAKLPRTTITKIESGNYNPTIHTLMSIASAMDKKLEVKLV